MVFLWKRFWNIQDANVDICHPIHPHHLESRWCVCAPRCVYISAHDTPCLRASSKALSGALCGPRSLPFHSPSFCLSVSYLIELARKQSRDGTWGWGCRPTDAGLKCLLSACLFLTVYLSPVILSRQSMSCTSKDSPMMSLYSVRTARLLPHHHLPTDRLFLPQTGVLTDKWYTYGAAQREFRSPSQLSAVSLLYFHLCPAALCIAFSLRSTLSPYFCLCGWTAATYFLRSVCLEVRLF